MSMCSTEYFNAKLNLNSQGTAPASASSMAGDAQSLSGDRNASAEDKSTGLGQVLARIREILWHLSA
jgi:hypothetical protein